MTTATLDHEHDHDHGAATWKPIQVLSHAAADFLDMGKYLILGALAGRYYFRRKFGKEVWRRSLPKDFKAYLMRAMGSYDWKFGESPLVDTTSSSVDASFSDAFIKDLPTQRNFYDIIAVAPDVSLATEDSDRMVAGGSNVQSNNWYIDGIETTAPETGTAWIYTNPDDIQEIHDWLDEYEKKTGISTAMHIDGASGGFVNPFLYPDYEWDFRLPRVQSINASGHKFGLVPPGLGWVVFRDRKVFNEDLVFYVNYLGGEAATATLNFSKSSATVLVQYYQMLRLGREGYTRIMKETLKHAEYLRDRLVATGKFQIMNETQRIPVVALTLDKSITKYNEFDISNKVRERGWILAAYSMPPNAQEINSLRIVVRPHMNTNVAELLAADIERACEFLEEHGGNATPPELHDVHHNSPAKC